MKSYIQGLLTGIFFTSSLFILMGQTTFDEQIKRQLKELEKLESEIETLGKSMSKSFNENKLTKDDFSDNPEISIHNKFEKISQKMDYLYKDIDGKIEKIYITTSDNNGILQDIYTDGVPCNN